VNWRDRVAAFDSAADLFVARVRNASLDAFMYRLSSAADHSLLWHACAAARALAQGGDIRDAARVSAALGVESAITNGLAKSLFGRLRPAEYAEIEFRHGLRRPVTSSFPSGHAAAAFCAATLFGGGVGWYSAAALVASTRVYVRLHYASDVVAGAALGLALGAVMRPLVRGGK
jgi:undecaprenyl-diphosphatase